MKFNIFKNYLLINRIIQYIHDWVLLRIYILFPFCAPTNIKIGKCVKVDLLSLITFTSDSLIDIGDNSIIKKTRFSIINSSVKIHKNFISHNSTLIFRNSKFISQKELKIEKFNLQLNNSNIEIGAFNRLSKDSYYEAFLVADNSSISFGDNVNIQGKIKVHHSHLTIGNNTFINNGTEMRCFDSIKIGSNVFISYECLIFDTNTHSLNPNHRIQEIVNGFPNSTIQTEGIKPSTKAINIGDNVWIGMRASILKGSNLEKNSIVGMNSVVAGLIAGKNSIIVGNPAKVIKKIEE